MQCVFLLCAFRLDVTDISFILIPNELREKSHPHRDTLVVGTSSTV